MIKIDKRYNSNGYICVITNQIEIQIHDNYLSLSLSSLLFSLFCIYFVPHISNVSPIIDNEFYLMQMRIKIKYFSINSNRIVISNKYSEFPL